MTGRRKGIDDEHDGTFASLFLLQASGAQQTTCIQILLHTALPY